MAYMNQEKKAKIAAALKLVVPKGWKYSLSVHNHSTLIMTISEAPFDLIRAIGSSKYFDAETAMHADVNTYHIRNHVNDECVADVFEKIVEALNTGNHDRSDLMTDYFDVGHYIALKVGRWDRPFVCTAQAIAA